MLLIILFHFFYFKLIFLYPHQTLEREREREKEFDKKKQGITEGKKGEEGWGVAVTNEAVGVDLIALHAPQKGRGLTRVELAAMHGYTYQ